MRERPPANPKVFRYKPLAAAGVQRPLSPATELLVSTGAVVVQPPPSAWISAMAAVCRLTATCTRARRAARADALRGDDVGVAELPGAVAVEDLLLGLVGRVGGLLLQRRLFFVGARVGELVLDALEGDEHGLSVARDGSIARGFRRADPGADEAAVEHGLRHRGADRPEQVRRLEEVADARAVVAERRAQGQAREVRRLLDADLRIGRCDQPLRRCDVGPALQQGRRNAQRHRRHDLVPGRDGDREIACRLACEDGDRVLVPGAIGTHRRQRRACARELRLRLQHVGLGSDAGVVAVLRDLQGALVALDALAEQVGFEIGFAQREVVGRHLALRREAGRREIGRARLGAGPRAFDAPADAAPEVGCPVALQRRREGVADGRDRSAGALGRAAALATPAAAPARAHANARKIRRAGLAHQRLGLAVRRHRGRHRLVRRIDVPGQPVERRVVEQRPPVAAIESVGRRGAQPRRTAGRHLLVDGRDRCRRPRVVWADGTSRQRRGEHGCEQRPETTGLADERGRRVHGVASPASRAPGTAGRGRGFRLRRMRSSTT